MKLLNLISEYTALLALVSGVTIETLALASLEITQTTARTVVQRLLGIVTNDGGSINKLVPETLATHLFHRDECVSAASDVGNFSCVRRCVVFGFQRSLGCCGSSDRGLEFVVDFQVLLTFRLRDGDENAEIILVAVGVPFGNVINALGGIVIRREPVRETVFVVIDGSRFTVVEVFGIGTLRGGGIQDIRVWRAVTRTSCVRNSGRWGGSFESFSCADFCLEFGHTHRRVNENVVWIRTVVEHSVNIRVANDIIGKGLDGGVDLFADETVVEREFNRFRTIFLGVHSRDRRALVGSRSFGSTVHIHNWSVLTLEVRIHEERSAGEFASFVGRTNFQRSSSSASLVVGGDGTRGPDVAIVVLVTHRPVHLPVRVFIWLPLRVLGTPYLACYLSPLDFVYTVIVDVYSGNGITSQRTLAQRTISTSVTGIALAFNCLLFVPSTVVGIRHSHVHTLTMATATVRAGDTAATLTFETRETCTLTSCAIANALVTALAVEVGLIPGFRVVFTGQTVSSIVLFANETVCVLVLDLLVSVNLVVGINVAKR